MTCIILSMCLLSTYQNNIKTMLWLHKHREGFWSFYCSLRTFIWTKDPSEMLLLFCINVFASGCYLCSLCFFLTSIFFAQKSLKQTKLKKIDRNATWSFALFVIFVSLGNSTWPLGQLFLLIGWNLKYLILRINKCYGIVSW